MEPSRRHAFFERFKREIHRLPPIESMLQGRAQWMLRETGIVGDLEKKVWPDSSHPRKIEVLCLGAGKGHEMEAIRRALPSVVIWGVDPHDHYAPDVERRLEDDHEVFYLHESVSAEDLRELPNESQDAITLHFVLHHIDAVAHDKVFAEIARVLKFDGRVYIAEDIVDSDEERAVTERIDRRINFELGGGPHNYRSIEEWRVFFKEKGFDVERVHETKPDKVRHGWFVLKREPLEM